MSRLVSTALIFAVLAYAYALSQTDYDFFLQSVQEDEYLEWSTFWGFILASVLFILAARQQHKVEGKIPWFLTGVGIFCFIFAMEEISWGQRVLGFRPPAYFLDENFQQELNYHNIISKWWRKTALKLIMLAYGFALPVLAMEPSLRRWIDKLAIVPPAAIFILPFTVAVFFYHEYPLEYSGEIVELMFAFCFIFSAMDYLQQTGFDFGRQIARIKGFAVPKSLVAMALAVVVIGAGAAGGAISRSDKTADPELLRMAKVESTAIAEDLLWLIKNQQPGARSVTQCQMHTRLYSYVIGRRYQRMNEGNYHALTQSGLPEERAKFFIDPCNSPYWIRQYCNEDRTESRIYVYSFGPNRKRDSARHNIDGDDIGVIIRRRARQSGINQSR